MQRALLIECHIDEVSTFSALTRKSLKELKAQAAQMWAVTEAPRQQVGSSYVNAWQCSQLLFVLLLWVLFDGAGFYSMTYCRLRTASPFAATCN